MEEENRGSPSVLPAQNVHLYVLGKGTDGLQGGVLSQ